MPSYHHDHAGEERRVEQDHRLRDLADAEVDDDQRDQRDRRQGAEEVDERVDEACARRGYQPIAKPTGTATSTPSDDADEDALRRHPDVERRAGRCASSTNLASTACGAGTSAGLTSPLARTAYQRRRSRARARRSGRRGSQGVARLRLQSDKRTINHPFIAQPTCATANRESHRCRSRPRSLASRRTCCAGRCGFRCERRSATCTTGPAVLVRVEDGEGAFGWGEAWCNFPACGAEHRARLVETVLAPLVVGRAFASPAGGVRRAVSERPRCSRSSRASPGRSRRRSPASTSPLHDLAARRAGLPLWRHLSATRRACGRDGDARGAGLCERHQPRAARATTVAALRRSRHTRVQAEGRLRRGARRRQPRRRARRGRRRTRR